MTHFKTIQQSIESKGLHIVSQDIQKPWGGFFCIDDQQMPLFIDTYFPDLKGSSLISINDEVKYSPKILVVQPFKRLSWQYHFRRSEIWKVIQGEVQVAYSFTDNEEHHKTLQKNHIIFLEAQQRHRLIGLKDVGVVAEIWQHTDPENLSDENDIVRVQDDFGR